jgi:hypothetical protein
MIIYFYNKETFEYIGQGEAQRDVLESEKQDKEIYMFPPNSTEIKPDLDNLGENEVYIFSVSEKTWNIDKDFRGTQIYHINDKYRKIITEIGESPDDYEDYTLLEPPNGIGGKYVFRNGEWVIDKEREKEIEEKNYLQKVILKKYNEIIIQALIDDGILSSSGEILKDDVENLGKDIFQMIVELGD